MSHGQQRQEQMTNIVDGNKSAISLFPFFQVNLMVVRIPTYSDFHDLRPCHGRVSLVSPLYPAGSSRRTQFPPNHLSIIQSRAATLDMRLDPDQVQKWLTIH